MENRDFIENKKNAILSRRKALTGMFWLMAGVSISCSPIRLVLDIKKEKVFDDPDSEDRTLRAFVATIIPGVNISNPHLTDVFHDKFYQFKKYKSAFANDLNRRSWKLFGNEFKSLNTDDRTKVVADGLGSIMVASRLYSGAIFLTQIAVYSGTANNDNGCSLIDFKGTYNFEPTTYPDADRFFGEPTTQTGHPV